MAEEIDEYPLCPEEFRANCAAYEVRCEGCKGKLGEGELFYNPVLRVKGLGKRDHPANKRTVDKQRSRNTRKGIRQERKGLEEIGAKGTVGSGRVYGDGDGVIEIRGIRYGIEYKTRMKEMRLASRAEWSKAKKQGCSILIVEAPGERVVLMTMEVFKELLGGYN